MPKPPGPRVRKPVTARLVRRRESSARTAPPSRRPSLEPAVVAPAPPPKPKTRSWTVAGAALRALVLGATIAGSGHLGADQQRADSFLPVAGGPLWTSPGRSTLPLSLALPLPADMTRLVGYSGSVSSERPKPQTRAPTRCTEEALELACFRGPSAAYSRAACDRCVQLEGLARRDWQTQRLRQLHEQYDARGVYIPRDEDPDDERRRANGAPFCDEVGPDSGEPCAYRRWPPSVREDAVRREEQRARDAQLRTYLRTAGERSA